MNFALIEMLTQLKTKESCQEIQIFLYFSLPGAADPATDTARPVTKCNGAAHFYQVAVRTWGAGSFWKIKSD